MVVPKNRKLYKLNVIEAILSIDQSEKFQVHISFMPCEVYKNRRWKPYPFKSSLIETILNGGGSRQEAEYYVGLYRIKPYLSDYIDLEDDEIDDYDHI